MDCYDLDSCMSFLTLGFLFLFLFFLFLIARMAIHPELTLVSFSTYIQVGATLQTSCYSVPHIMVGRFITGIGTGIETSTVPMYQAELCEARKRGRLVCSEALFVGLGIVICMYIIYTCAVKI